MAVQDPPVKASMLFGIARGITREWIQFFVNLQLTTNENESVGGATSFTELTISGGAVTVTDTERTRYHSIDTEANAATDDLDTINGGNVGEILVIQAEDSGRTVVCKKGASLRIQADCVLNHEADKLMLMCRAEGVWDETGRSSNG